MGALGWSPQDFWDATPAELDAAVTGWRYAHGAGEPPLFDEEEMDRIMSTPATGGAGHG